jgi:energy-coupling factor transporter ATP-binding protein EcfA2
MNAQVLQFTGHNFDLEDLVEDDYDPCSQADQPGGGFEPLGIEGTRAAVFSLQHKAVFKLKPTEMNELNLKMTLGVEWYNWFIQTLQGQVSANQSGAKGAKSKKPGHAEVASHIIEMCQAKGPYVATQERKTGVWLGEDGQLVINSDELWQPDGTVRPHGIHGDFVYPVAKPIGFGLQTPMATPDEVERLLGSMRSFNWQSPMAAEALLGWIGVATVSAAVRRRPHILIAGPAGCGKSTLLVLLTWLQGNNIANCTGSPTLMGLNQLVQDRPSRAVAIDEFEADGQSSRCKQAFEAARAAYSLQEGDAGIVRGTPGGEAKCYRMSSPFIAAGISPGRMDAADLSRWLVLEANKRDPSSHSANSLISEAEATEMGPRLARLFVDRWSVFQGSLEPIRLAVQSRGGDARLADTFGYLLAAYWAFISSHTASTDEAETLVDGAGIAARVKSQTVLDEQECLNAMLTRVLAFESAAGGRSGTRKLSIGEAIKEVVADRRAAQAVVDRLARLGIRVALVKGHWMLFVANSGNHAELRRVFSGSKWANGGWGMVLRRLPGGGESTQRIASGLAPCKVTVFDLPIALSALETAVAAA